LAAWAVLFAVLGGLAALFGAARTRGVQSPSDSRRIAESTTTALIMDIVEDVRPVPSNSSASAVTVCPEL
jgi:hypothetical protein